jgi:hypothetical protein
MERLTFRSEGKAYLTSDVYSLHDVIDKLADYEDLNEQGLLLRLPCKIGEIVFLIRSHYTKCMPYGERLDETNCSGCEQPCDSKKVYYTVNYQTDLKWIFDNLENFNKTWFLTKSEAEQALKRMDGGIDENG